MLEKQAALLIVLSLNVRSQTIDSKIPPDAFCKVVDPAEWSRQAEIRPTSEAGLYATTERPLLLKSFGIPVTPQPLSSTPADANDLTPEARSMAWTPYTIAGSAGITALLFVTDQKTYDDLYSWKIRHRLVREASPVITNAGNGLFSVGMFGGFMAYSWIFDQDGAYETGKVGLESFLASGAAVQFMKMMFSRERPSAATASRGVFHGPFAYFEQKGPQKGIASFDAFPSGHAATAFAAAATLSDLSSSSWVSYTSYSIATGVAVSRITERDHWASDCFVGALIGIVSTKLVEQMNAPTSDFGVQPLASEKRYGLSLSMKL